jgi:D-alanine-D-alanine ligase
MKTRVAVLRGGPSEEYDVSLNTGKEVLSNLPDTYHPIDIFISKEGEWHIHGIPKKPEEIVPHVDVFFNALHGSYGEDGKVQKILDHHNVPYTGSGALASAIAMNKVLTKRELLKHGVKMPVYTTITLGQDIDKRAFSIFRTMPMPAVVKPADQGSSIGVTIARDFESLLQGIYKALEISDTAIVEEYIQGREATCGVVEDFRGQKTYALLPVEIIPGKSTFFDYDEKYSGTCTELCPGNFSSEEKRIIQNAAAIAHRAIDLRHYSRSDFIVHPKRGVYFLEVNTLPGLTSESLFPKSLKAVGATLPEFLDHVITQTLDRRRS